MDFYASILFLVLVIPFSQSTVVLRPISSINIPSIYGPDGVTGLSYGIETDAIEQSAYDENTGLVYAAGSAYIHVVDYSNLTDPVILHSIATPNQPINDVEQCGSRVAFAVEGINKEDPGEVRVYNLFDKARGAESFTMEFPPITVGYGPDMLHFSEDCNTIVTADEGEPYASVSPTGVVGAVIDPEGSVTIIRLHDGSPNVTTLNFTSFNDRAAEYINKGVRQNYRGQLSMTASLLSQTMEPEYVTFNKDETKAYVGLQEANAIAVVNLVNDTIDEIYPLGVKSWKNLVLDGSDKDSGINLTSYDIFSFYQPDSIKFFDFLGKSYIITGNEGENTELEGYNQPTQKYTDAKRGRKMLQDVQISPNVDLALREALSDDTRLGRLEFSVIDGLSARNPTQVERLHFFGGRGISIFNAEDMTQVWDSGDMIEKMHAELYPDVFNANSKPDNPAIDTPADLMDKRSDNHGPECESLALGQLDNTRLVFVGMGRTSSIAIFRIEALFDGPHLPVLELESLYRAGGTNDTFNMLLDDENIGNLDPEDLRFIPASKSATGHPLLLVTGTTSGNLVMYEVIDDQKFAKSSGACALCFSFLTLLFTLFMGASSTREY